VLGRRRALAAARLPGSVPVLLTDLYPHNETVIRVDARAVPAELDGFRTIFTAFHHFRAGRGQGDPPDAVAARQGIGVFRSRAAPRSRCGR